MATWGEEGCVSGLGPGQEYGYDSASWIIRTVDNGIRIYFSLFEGADEYDTSWRTAVGGCTIGIGEWGTTGSCLLLLEMGRAITKLLLPKASHWAPDIDARVWREGHCRSAVAKSFETLGLPSTTLMAMAERHYTGRRMTWHAAYRSELTWCTEYEWRGNPPDAILYHLLLSRSQLIIGFNRKTWFGKYRRHHSNPSGFHTSRL